MRTLKRSAIILTISIAGLLVINAADKTAPGFTGQHFTLEQLGWQSAIPGTERTVSINHAAAPGHPAGGTMVTVQEIGIAEALKCADEHEATIQQ